MAKGHKCPICKHFTYFISKGEYEYPFGKKLTPDIENCSFCGFRYDESVDYKKDYNKMVNDYKKQYTK